MLLQTKLKYCIFVVVPMRELVDILLPILNTNSHEGGSLHHVVQAGAGTSIPA
jgi:hypothetical protein